MNVLHLLSAVDIGEIFKNEWLGIVASAFILVSFLFTKQTITRLINMVGCVAFVIYALWLLPTPSYATAFMNGALFVVHVVYLVRGAVAAKKAKQRPEDSGEQQK